MVRQPGLSRYYGHVADFEWDPVGYLELVRKEVPGYDQLQEELVRATADVGARAILELGCGSGETAQRVLDAHPDARLTGVDTSAQMLAAAREALVDHDVELLERRLQEPLPDGPFDLVVSALAVHHLDGPGKAELFGRLPRVLAPGGRVVLADLVVPDDPADLVTPIDRDRDQPSAAADQLTWLRDAGLEGRIAWAEADLAVIVAALPVGDRA